eukprot:CAMPEP_0172907610 /NCGR_PEP_ID=MMETSP1075-20121228/179186_1 /TAXON_ID=2916 /ORGANISM="Ceratium fusus, Strain PA161109" /LENGTH=59 /DNA_ID=CAMNT_0013765255 /DNA_START=177 /DNA_END=353 /DNA_ORIENTATION=-
MVVLSWNSAPTACKPTGNPSCERPAGKDVAGLKATFVTPDQKTCQWYGVFKPLPGITLL